MILGVKRRPSRAAEWKELLGGAVLVLTPRELEAMTIHYVDWPDGVSNLRYMTQRQMAEKMGVSVVGFRLLLHKALFKLGLTPFAPRMAKIPVAIRRLLLEAVDGNSMCDLCQRSLGRIPVPDGELTWADLMGPPRFSEAVSIDHIVPVVSGGTDDISNLRVVHALCNLRDGARRPIDEYAPAPYGYVRRSEDLPDGRGPRTWIEVVPKQAAVVTWIHAEYAGGRHSLRSLARTLAKQRRQFDKRAVAPFVRGHIDARGRQLLELLSDGRYRGIPRSRLMNDRPRRSSPYPVIVSEDVGALVQRYLELRWQRIQRAAETRARNQAKRSRTKRPSC